MTIIQQSNSSVSFDRHAVARRRQRMRLKRHFIQWAILAAIAALIIAFVLAVKNGLGRHGIVFSFSYLWQSSGFDISEGKTLAFDGGWWATLTGFNASHSSAQAFIAGLYNTIKVAALAILTSTMFGTLLGVGRLSTNWLVRQLSFGLVEFVRNTPLLIQLVFWYFAVVLNFPPLATAAKFYGGIIISKQGNYFPVLMLSETMTPLGIITSALALLAFIACLLKRFTGYRLILLGGALVFTVLTLLAGSPFVLDYPVASRFQASGGTSISPEMAALLLAITVNSAAYIAEIVRGAIEAMPKGQWEAAAALGLNRKQSLKDIILPQVFRVVLPSFGNQYINLMKNTSLGIAIGYPELFNVYGTLANQTGRSLEGIAIVMVIYLLLSWIISALVNLANRHMAKRGDTR